MTIDDELFGTANRENHKKRKAVQGSGGGGGGGAPDPAPYYTVVREDDDINNKKKKIDNEDDEYDYDKPIRFVDHRPALDRVARWANATYASYTRQLSELTQTKSSTYANPEHTRRGFDGDERLFNLRRDLQDFSDVPIELQMKMYVLETFFSGPILTLRVTGTKLPFR